MKSIVRIYKTGIIEERNMVIDDIEEYLTHQTLFYSSADFQYIKQTEMYISIKIDKPATYIDNTENYNYCVIQNYTDGVSPVLERKYYYFVESSEWKSSNTIKLNLKLDVLNTFKLNTDYTLSNFTKINREHKNRYKRIGTTNNFKILVDKYDEGIEAIKYKDAITKSEFYETYGNNGWTLLYKNNDAIDPDKYNQVNPISTFLYPNRSIRINYFNGETDLYSACNSLLPNYLVISPKYNTPSNPNGLTIKVSSTNNGTKYYRIYREHLGTAGSYYDYCVYCLEGVATQTNVIYCRELYISNTYQSTEIIDEFATGEYDAHNIFLEGVISFSSLGTQILKYADKATYDTGAPSTSSNSINITYTHSYNYLKESRNVDKTESTIIKMLKLPYCPIPQITGYSSLLSFDNTMANISGYDYNVDLELLPELEYKNTIYTDGDIFDFVSTTLTIADTQTRINEDTKLCHSAFSYWKFAYDEFYKIIAMEDLNTWNMNILNPEVYFKMTKTINSRFLFHLYNLDNLVQYSQEDYDNIVSVARSLEETIYSNQYINYLRNGYNYDVKNKNRQLIFGALGVGMSALGMGVDLGNQAQSKTGLTALGGIGASGGLISGTLNFINNAISTEMQMEQKQQQLKAQATNVSGSDDVDLLEYYNGNKAFVIYYSINDNMKKLVDDLFYYCGYACNRMGQPNTTSRIWWNFIQANLVYKTCNFEKSYQVEMSSKWANGITIYHNRSQVWDLAQVKENWESDFFN